MEPGLFIALYAILSIATFITLNVIASRKQTPAERPWTKIDILLLIIAILLVWPAVAIIAICVFLEDY